MQRGVSTWDRGSKPTFGRDVAVESEAVGNPIDGENQRFLANSDAQFRAICFQCHASALLRIRKQHFGIHVVDIDTLHMK